MTPIELILAAAVNFFTGCTQQLLTELDKKAASRAVDRQLWTERGKTFEQRISQQLALAAHKFQLEAKSVEALRSVLSDQVLATETVQAFLAGRLTAKAFTELVALHDPSLSVQPAVTTIGQTLVDVYTAAVAGDPELSRIVTLKRSEAMAGQLSHVQFELEQQRQLLTELAKSSALAGQPNETLSQTQRYERAISEVAAAHKLTVQQLRDAISTFSERIAADSGASEFDRALAMVGKRELAGAETSARQAVVIADKAAEQAIDDKRKALLLLGDVQMAQLKYSAAEKTYRDAYAVAEQQNILYAADVGWRLSRLLGQLGRYDEAVAIARPFLEIAEHNFGAPGTMVALNHLGLALQGAGRYQDAERILRRALEVWQSQAQGEDLMLATHLHNLSTVLRDLGKRREAEPLARRALAIRQRFLGEDHPDVATCLTNVALSLDDSGDLREAESLLQAALASYKKYLPENHPYCITAASNVAINLKDQGRLDEAEPALRSVLDSTERVFGREHPDIGNTLSNLGEVLLARGKVQEAIAAFREALEMYRKLLGAEHPTTQRAANNLGPALVFAKKFVEAEQVLRQALAIKEKVMPGDHISIAHTVNNLAFALHMQRRFDEAEPLYRRAIALRTEALPPTHTQLANSFGNLGLLLHDTGRYSDAADMFRRELEIREHEKPGSKRHTALALNNLGSALYLAGKLQDAAEAFDRAVSYCRQHFGEEHGMTRDALQKLATTRAQISGPS